MSEPEIALPSQRTEVHQSGDMLLRKAGPWSDSVLSLLRHLEQAGFAGAPRVVGTGYAEDGRETLTFIPGDVSYLGIWSAEGIDAYGQILAALHDAGAGFKAPKDAVWQPWFTRSDAADAVFGHGDVGPWNVVARDGIPVAFIDWEFAGPVDRLDEVAQAGWLNAQLHDDLVAERADLPPAAERAALLKVFVDAYGLTRDERSGLITRMVDFAVRDAANEITQGGGLKMGKRPTGPDDPGGARRGAFVPRRG